MSILLVYVLLSFGTVQISEAVLPTTACAYTKEIIINDFKELDKASLQVYNELFKDRLLYIECLETK